MHHDDMHTRRMMVETPGDGLNCHSENDDCLTAGCQLCPGQQDADDARRYRMQSATGSGIWQPITTAPKDGRAVLLLSVGDEGMGDGVLRPPKVHIGHWNPEGTSWVDEYGQLGQDCYTLAQTGFWESGLGWFQPNEVSHWMPLPLPPTAQEAT